MNMYSKQDNDLTCRSSVRNLIITPITRKSDQILKNNYQAPTDNPMDISRDEPEEQGRPKFSRRNRRVSGTFNYQVDSIQKIKESVGFKGALITPKKKFSVLDIRNEIKSTVVSHVPPKLATIINEYLNSIDPNKGLPLDYTFQGDLARYDTPTSDNRKLETFKNVYDSLSDTGNEEELVFDGGQFSFFVIHPYSHLNTVWSLIMFFLVLYSVTVTPYIIAFNIESPDIITLEIIVDFLFLTDVFLNFFMPYHEGKKYISNHKDIVKNYLQHWFVFDLATSLPIGLLTETDFDKVRSFGKILRLTRLMRLAKWLRVIRLFKLFQNGNKVSDTIMDFEIVSQLQFNRLLKFTVILVIMVHISSCLWIYVGKQFDYNTWIIHSGLYDEDNVTIYVSSLYFIMITILSIGYGDIVSTNFYERLFNLFFMIIGLIFFSFTLSSLAGIFSKMDEKSLRLDGKFKILQGIAKDYDVPNVLRTKIVKTIKHENNMTGYGKYDFIETLPNLLKNELITAIHKKYMNKLFFFKSMPLDFIDFILPMLQAIPFNKTEILFNEGITPDEMYLIVKGSLSLTLGSFYGNYEIGMLPSNTHFGDILLYMGYPSPYNLITRTSYVEVLVLKKKDFMRIKKSYYSNLLAILSQSINDFELFERRRLLITEIYKYETDHKVIRNLMKCLNIYLLHKDDDHVIESNVNFEELNNFFEKIANTEFKNKFSEIANKFESDARENPLSDSSLSLSPTINKKHDLMAKRRMSVEIFAGSVLLPKNNTNDLTAQVNPYKSLIEKILNLNQTQSGISDNRTRTSVLSNGSGLNFQQLREEISVEANKTKKDFNELDEVKQGLFQFSKQPITKRKPVQLKNVKISSKRVTKHARPRPTRKGRPKSPMSPKTPKTPKSSKLPNRKVSKRVDHMNLNEASVRKSTFYNGLSPVSKDSQNGLYGRQSSDSSNETLKNYKPIIDIKEAISSTITDDSKSINIQVFNYETKINNNIILLGNDEEKVIDLQTFLDNQNKKRSIKNQTTLDVAAKLLSKSSNKSTSNVKKLKSLVRKLDRMYYVLKLNWKIKKGYLF
jgi:CRP-like cAMP-binding protein